MKDKELISKWLNRELSPEEKSALQKLPEYRDYNRIIKAAAKFDQPAFDQEKTLDLIRQRISGRSSGKIIKADFSSFYRIAAVFIVLLATGWFIWINSPTTVSTGNSEMSYVELPDASGVRLNAGSKMKYNPHSWNSNREVKLEGEAFFEVDKGSKFTVKTRQGDVQVLGTRFNVKNRSGYFEVYCFEGSVKVIRGEKEWVLELGDFYKDIEGEVQTGEAVAGDIPGWIIEESRFRGVPLKYVIAEAERQFDIEIHTENIDLNQRFTGSFSHSDKIVALKAITAPLQLKYRIESGDKVILYEQ